MTIRSLMLVPLVTWLGVAVGPHAQQAPDYRSALEAIAAFTVKVCPDVPNASSSSTMVGEAQAKIELSKLAKRLASIDASFGGRIQDTRTYGLLQQDLLKAREDVLRCRGDLAKVVAVRVLAMSDVERGRGRVRGIRLTPESQTVAPGGLGRIVALVEVDPPLSSAVVWSTSDARLATVDPSGQVRGISRGTAVITAASVANMAVRGAATVRIVVPDPPPKTRHELMITLDSCAQFAPPVYFGSATPRDGERGSGRWEQRGDTMTVSTAPDATPFASLLCHVALPTDAEGTTVAVEASVVLDSRVDNPPTDLIILQAEVSAADPTPIRAQKPRSPCEKAYGYLSGDGKSGRLHADFSRACFDGRSTAWVLLGATDWYKDNGLTARFSARVRYMSAENPAP